MLRLLSEGTLFAADKNGNKIEDIFFPIIKIIREEIKGENYEFVISDDDKNIDIYLNNILNKSITRNEFSNQSEYLYNQILSNEQRAFQIDKTQEFMESIGCRQIKAPSTDKSDINIKLKDVQTGYSSSYGFSIKSQLGSPSTLVNAAKSTNFIYKVSGLSDSDIAEVNSITCKNKIKERMEFIFNNATKVEFHQLYNDTFARNLMLIDSKMPELVSSALLEHYRSGIDKCMDVVTVIEALDPLCFRSHGFYEYKFKKMLCSCALGMTPAKEWTGVDEASGGYIIVNTKAEVLAYHIYNRNSFESYLLNNTKFEHASTSRHDYAKLYKTNGETFLNLNLQIRFSK